MSLKFNLLFLLFMIIPLFSLPQEVTFGPVNGINFSNLRGELSNHTWNTKPGPVNGFFVRSTVSNWFALKTGAEFTSFYYKGKWIREYYIESDTWDYHFLRVPLVLQWKTPGRLSFGFGSGVFYSFLMNDEFTGKDKKLYPEEFRNENFPSGTDWGWLFSAALNYSLNNRWSVFLEGRTTYGNEEYLGSVDGKHGSSELLFGVGFSPFPKAEKDQPDFDLGRRVEIIPHTGITFSKSVAPDEKQNYAMLPAFNSGISVKFKPDPAISLVSGAWYEQKGYRINKPSQTRLYYTLPLNEEQNISMNSDISLDYLTIPLLGEVSFGGRFATNIQIGLYYSLLQNARVTGEETQKYIYGQGYQIRRVYYSQNVKGWFRNDDFGGLTGLQFEYRIFSKTKIHTSLQRAWGYSKLRDKDDDDASGPAPELLKNFRNFSWSASLGLVIPLDQN